MRENKRPEVFYLAHRWLPLGLGLIMLGFGFIALALAIVQGAVPAAVLLSGWLAILSVALWRTRKQRLEVTHDALRIKWPIGSQTISWNDVTLIQELTGRTKWGGPLAFWRTAWAPNPSGSRGLLIERVGLLLPLFRRVFITVDRHEEFVAALEATGLTVRRLNSDVE